MRVYNWKPYAAVFAKHCSDWNGKDARNKAVEICSAETLPIGPDHLRMYLSAWFRDNLCADTEQGDTVIHNGGESKSSWEEGKDSASFEYKGPQKISNFDEALEHCGVDLSVWEVERKVFNSWDTTLKDKAGNIVTRTNYQYKLWFKRKEAAQSPAKQAFERLIEKLDTYKAPIFQPLHGKRTGTLGIINIFDAHLDKLCRAIETGAESDSSLSENIRTFEQCFNVLLSDVSKSQPETIVIPLGNDLQQTIGPQNTTKRGTPQDVTDHFHDASDRIMWLILRCIDKARQIAPVKIIMIAGNHDEDAVYNLGRILQGTYRGIDTVEIDNSRTQRKYLRWGLNLFGFAHGDKEFNKVDKLPVTMSLERRADWAEIRFAEWYLGDKHHKQEHKFMRVKDFAGATVRFLRSISGDDKWHVDEQWIGVPKSAEAFIWSKDKGMVGTHQYNIL
jgi:hypothetical protein